MAREYTKAVLHLSCDERLVAGVGGALSYFAERAGMERRSRESLVSALEEFCVDALPSTEAHDLLDIAIEDFEDRIEIVIQQCNGNGNGRHGKHASHAEPAPKPQPVTLRRLAQAVDRIECDTRSGNIRTTLVKFL